MGEMNDERDELISSALAVENSNDEEDILDDNDESLDSETPRNLRMDATERLQRATDPERQQYKHQVEDLDVAFESTPGGLDEVIEATEKDLSRHRH